MNALGEDVMGIVQRFAATAACLGALIAGTGVQAAPR